MQYSCKLKTGINCTLRYFMVNRKKERKKTVGYFVLIY